MSGAAMPEGFECWSVRIGDVEFFTDPSDMYPQAMLAHINGGKLTVKALHDDRLIVAKNDCAIHPWGKDAPQESLEVSCATAEYLWNLQYLRGDGLSYERADCLKNINEGKHPGAWTEHHWPGSWSGPTLRALVDKGRSLNERLWTAAIVAIRHRALAAYEISLSRLADNNTEDPAKVEALLSQFTEDYKQGVIDGWIRGWECYALEAGADMAVLCRLPNDDSDPIDLNVPRAAKQSKKKLAEFRKHEKLAEAANGYLPPKA